MIRSVSYLPAWLLACLLMLPSLVILSAFTDFGGDGLTHLYETVLGRYLTNTLWLAVGVGSLSFVIGTSTAWLVTMYQFPGRRLFGWLLIAPLAMPAYVLAMLYGWFFESAGPVQTFVRDATGLAYGEYWFFDIRSLEGAIFVLSMTGYVYVYLMASMAFKQQSRQLLESAMMLDCSPWRLFLKVALPSSRPAIVVGLALVIMETLADFGTVSLFGVQSFTTGIYRLWYNMADPSGAAQLSAMLLVLVLGMLWMERYGRRQARYANTTALYHPFVRTPLRGWQGLSASFLCLIPVLLGCLLPFGLLVHLAFSPASAWEDMLLWESAWNSMVIAVCVVVLTLSIALYFAYLQRQALPKLLRAALRLASSGYAIPGSVIAVGLLVPFLAFDQWFADRMEMWNGASVGLVLTGSIAAVVLACSIRFLAVAQMNLESVYTTITPMMDDASKMLGYPAIRLWWRIHLPMLRGGLFIAAMMVCVDTIKELPATLLLRPFNFDTLAIRTYELAMDERLIQAAAPALVLVLLSFIPIIFLYRPFETLRSES